MSATVLSVRQRPRRLFVIDAAFGLAATWIAAHDVSVLATQQCVNASTLRKPR